MTIDKTVEEICGEEPSDLISRKAVLEMLEDLLRKLPDMDLTDEECGYETGIENVRDKIQSMPAIDKEE